MMSKPSEKIKLSRSKTIRPTPATQLTIVLLFLCPTLALAANFGGIDSDMLTTVLQGLVTLITSTYARLFMVIGIVAVGYLWMWKGSIPSGRAISTIIGIGIVFSASFLCTALGIPGS